MHRVPIAAAALMMAPVVACAEMVTGSATYLQRIALPPTATVEIVLQDTSLADAPAKTLGTFTISPPGNPPFGFAFDVAEDKIDAANSYSVRATVRDQGKLLMTTDTVYPVLTRGASNNVDMVMKMVSDPAAAKPDSDFVNTYWKLVTLQGETVPVANNKREPHVILRSDGTYNATVGCNTIRGAHAVDGAKVSFKPGAMTQMACVPPLDRFEQSLAETLASAASFGISGETMELVDPAGGTLATFVAVYF